MANAVDIVKITHNTWAKWTSAYRDPRYVISALVSLVIFGLLTVQAIKTIDEINAFEVNLFVAINNWPSWLLAFFYSVTQLGSLSSVVLWSSFGTYISNLQAGLVVALSGISAWLVTKPLKSLVGRERPDLLIDGANLLSSENFKGLGYPSGHAAVSAACATALYYYVPHRYRKYVLLTVLLVGISRVYLGGHFVGDILSGWTVGVLMGSLATLLLGTQRKKISVPLLKKKLAEIGIEATSTQQLKVDARGSVPFIVHGSDGTKYIAKLFGKQEHAADWLFKITRYFRFKSFSDEEPYLNSKRNVEHEALVALWASKLGVQTPEVVGYAKVGSYWMLVQRAVDAQQLNKLSKAQITDNILIKVWQEVSKLQTLNIAHRDLRPANVLVDTKGLPWLIDFGFAEMSARPTHKKMDIAELLMATSLLVGPKRSLEAAKKVLGKDALAMAAPYVQMAVFSGATTYEVRRSRSVYKELRELLGSLVADGKIEDAPVQRFKLKHIIKIILIGLFLFVLVPQFQAFKGALDSLSDINFLWLIPIILASMLSYVSSALALVTLSNTPISPSGALLSQIASSFASKVLPGGLGPATLLIRYLKKSGMDDSEAASLLVVQRIIDFAMFILPLSIILILKGGSITSLIKLPVSPAVAIAGIAIVLTIIVIAASIEKVRRRAIDFALSTYRDFQGYASSPKELGLTALLSFGVTASYVASLYFALLAVGLEVSPVIALVVYATATAAGATSPAPGGLGALEVAMVAVLIGLGFNQPASYAAVILYRLSTFWAPVPFGFIAYQYMQKKKML